MLLHRIHYKALPTLVLFAVGLLVLADDRQNLTHSNRTSLVSGSLSTRVHVLLGGKWRNVDDLQKLAHQFIDGKVTNVPWGNLKEVGAWIDLKDPKDYITFHFSFGLGNQSFLVSFTREGQLSHFNQGVANESVGTPEFEDFPVNPENGRGGHKGGP